MANNLPDASDLVPVDLNLSTAKSDTDVSDLPSIDQLVPIEKASWLEQADARFSSTKSDVESLGIMLEAYKPLGDFTFSFETGFDYISPEEKYGPEFSKLQTYDERRQFLVDLRNKQLEEEFKDVALSNEVYGEDTSAAILGTLGGALATPTTLLGGKGLTTIPRIIGAGALFGAEYSLLDQLSETGKADVKEVGKDALVAATVSPIPLVGGRLVKKTAGLVGKKKTAKQSDIEQANDVVDRLEAGYADGVVNKVAPGPKLYEHAKTVANLTDDEIQSATSLSGRKPRIVSAGNAKLQESIVTEGTDAVARQKSPVIDAFISSTSRVIGKIAPKLKTRLRKLDMQEGVMVRNKMQIVAPFNAAVKSMSGTSRRLFKRHVYNGDFTAARKLISAASAQGGKAFDDVTGMLRGTYDQLSKADFNIPRIQNFFHRGVKDYDGLYRKLSGKDRTAVDKLIDARRKNIKSELSEEDKANIINNYLRGYNVIGTGAGWTKSRTVNRLTDDMLDFYDDPVESLVKYVRSTSRNLARREFFKTKPSINGSALDTEGSIKNLLDELGSSVTSKNLDTLQNALRARFINGERSGGSVNETLRQFGYITTLPNPLSALTQLGDLALSVRINGMGNTIMGLLGKKNIKVDDLALNRIAAEFTDSSKLARAMNVLFKASGFSTIDRLGKTAFLNASLKKATRLAKSTKGREKLRKKYGDAFENFDSVMDDLAKGNITEDTKLYLWSELADIQPIGLSEYPQKYLDVPNGRIFYSLKSYTLKQLDYMRDTIVDEAAKGNVFTALKNATAYALLIPTANMTVDVAKDVILQRPIDFEEELGDRIVNNVWKTFGASSYIADNLGKTGSVLNAAENILLPPLDYIDHVGSTIMAAVSEDKELDPKALQSIPLVGRLLYNFMGGGLEKYEERRRDKILSGE